MRTLNKTLKVGKNINLQSYGGLVVPTCSPAHISRAIVTTHVSLGQAVPQSRFFDMNSPAVRAVARGVLEGAAGAPPDSFGRTGTKARA